MGRENFNRSKTPSVSRRAIKYGNLPRTGEVLGSTVYRLPQESHGSRLRSAGLLLVMYTGLSRTCLKRPSHHPQLGGKSYNQILKYSKASTSWRTRV